MIFSSFNLLFSVIIFSFSIFNLEIFSKIEFIYASLSLIESLKCFSFASFCCLINKFSVFNFSFKTLYSITKSFNSLFEEVNFSFSFFFSFNFSSKCFISFSLFDRIVFVSSYLFDISSNNILFWLISLINRWFSLSVIVLSFNNIFYLSFISLNSFKFFVKWIIFYSLLL